MVATKFLKECSRMCESTPCYECAFNGKGCFGELSDSDLMYIIKAIEKWSKEHPIVTNGDKVHELIPSYMRSITYNDKDKDFPFGIRAEDYVQILIPRKWWDAEYKEY